MTEYVEIRFEWLFHEEGVVATIDEKFRVGHAALATQRLEHIPDDDDVVVALVSVVTHQGIVRKPLSLGQHGSSGRVPRQFRSSVHEFSHGRILFRIDAYEIGKFVDEMRV